MKMKKRVTSFLLALLMAVTLLGNGPSVYAQTADGPAISAEETTNEMAEDEALLATPSEAEPSEEPEETEEQPEEVVETAETEEQPEEAVETAEKKEETPEEAAPEEPELSETEVPENGMPVATPSELMFRAAPLLTEYHAVEDESTIWFGSAFPNEASDQFYNVIYLEHPNHAAWKTIAYCINATKAYPQPTDNIKYDIGAYLPEWWEVDIASRFDGPRDGEEIAMEGLANALYKGYPVDAVGIQDLLGLTDHEFWYATQLAVHYWTDSYYDGHGTIDTQNLTLASYPRKHLISYAYLQLTQRNTFLPLPEDARMVMGRPSDDAMYQNLVALVFTERQLSIQKEDENHDPVEGAEFTVKRIYPSAEYSFVKDPYVRGFANLGTSDYNEYKMTSGEDGAISLIETGQMAETELDGERKAVLISGFYTLEETKTPDGYEGLKEPFIFHVDENGGITFHDKTGAVIHDPETRLGVSVEEFPSEGDDPSYEGSNIGFRFTITNRNVAPKVGALIVTKTVSGAGGDYNKEFTFTVTLDKTDITGQYGDMTFTDGVATFTLKHGQSKTATGLPAGVSYTVTESNNSGYTVNKTNDTGTIQQDVPATAAFENRNDTPPSYEVSFLKANEAGNPLSDATLTVNNQLTAQTYTWNTNTEVHTLTLKPGLYVVSETNAPGGYIKVKDFNFTLGADGVILLGDIAPGDVVKLEGRKITITDKAEPHEEEFSVEFSKVKLGGEELPGAKIEIYKGTDKVDGWESTTDSHTLSLEAGTYRFHEEAAPEGFVAVTDFEFTVRADGSVTLGTIAKGETVVAENGKITVTDNAKKHEVEFSKVKLGGEELPGAKIEIYKGTDKVDGWESTTDSHTLSLEAGTYRFHEEAAPEGFVAVTDFEFTVKADGSVTLGTIAQGETVVAENGKITVTDNAKTTPPTPDKKVGDLTVTKTVSGSRGDQNKEFTFTVTLDRTDITGKYGDMTFTGGVATFTLKHGQSNTASELPAGVAYTVEESDNSGYTVTKTNATGTIQKGVTATAAFENYKGGSGGGSSHTPQAARVTLTATKTVDGLIPTGSGFTFFLDDANGQRMQVKNNQGSHITFDTLTFTKTGTYVYYITEQTGNDKNINYDTASYKVTVTVTCPYDYEASVSYEKNGQAYHSIPAFANTTKSAVPVQPQTPVVPVQPQTPPVITPSRPLDNVPKTEDNTNLTLWSILAAASLLSLTALLAGNKTRKPHSQGKRNKS